MDTFFGSFLSVSCGSRVVPPGHRIFAAPTIGSNPVRFTCPTATFAGGEPTAFHIVYLCMKNDKAHNGRLSELKTDERYHYNTNQAPTGTKQQAPAYTASQTKAQIQHRMSTYPKFHLSLLLMPGSGNCTNPLAAMSESSDVARMAVIAVARLSSAPLR